MTFIDGSDDGSQFEPEPGPESQSEEVRLSPYAQNYLGSIEDEAEKAILQKHLPKWDSGFTKQMQKHAAASKAYQQFGSPDDVAKYARLYRMMEDDPQGTIQQLVDAGFYTPAQAKQALREAGEEEQQEFKLPSAYEEKFGKIDKVEQAVNTLLRSQQQQELIRRQQEEDRALEQATAALKKQHGDFPDELVYTIAHANGGDLEGAVLQYKAMIQAEVNKRGTKQAPPVMSGSTLPPLERKSTDMTPAERRAYIAQTLSHMKD